MNDMNATIARLERARSGKIILWTLLFLGGVVMITPIVFMASTSVSYTHLTLPTTVDV